VAWSPDGKYLASSDCYSNTMRVWETKSGLLLRTFPNAGSLSVAWSPDGETVACGMGGDAIRLLAIQPGGTSRTLDAVNGVGVTAIAWSPDGKTIAAGGGGNMLAIWDANSGTVRHKLGTHEKVRLVAWSPDGKLVAAAFGTGGIALWNAESGQPWGECKLYDCGSCLAWSPDGTKLATGGIFKWAFWDVQKRSLVYPSSSFWPDKNDFAISAAYSPDGNQLAFGSSGSSVWVYDARTGTRRHTLPGHGGHGGSWWHSVNSPMFSPSGNTIAFVDHGRCVRLWEVGSMLPPRRLYRACDGCCNGLAWSRNGGTLAASTNEWGGVKAQVWNTGSGQCKAFFPWADSSTARGIALSPEGATLATAAAEKTELWNAATGDMARKVGDAGFGVAWSPDGKILAVGVDHGVELRDPASGAITKTLSGPGAPVWGIAWSDDGRLLAGGTILDDKSDPKKMVFVWDVASGQVRRTCSDPDGNWACSLRWLHDGRTLVKSHVNGIHVWDVESGKLLHRIASSADDVSADGRLAVWGIGSAIRVLGLPDGRTLTTLLCLRDEQFALISPEGHYRGTPGVEKELVYVVQTDQGPETLTPEEFSKKYGWKNDPEKVSLKTEGGKGKAEAKADAAKGKAEVPVQQTQPSSGKRDQK